MYVVYDEFVMRSLSSGEARSSFADTLNHVAYGSEHVAIQRSGKDPVYMIPAKDYELFLNLLQQVEDSLDLREAEERMADSTQERVGFDEFFAELEASRE
jgi:PHD/YefM family antitoxin component YafN of YafNO toxin-antitoxin module